MPQGLGPSPQSGIPVSPVYPVPHRYAPRDGVLETPGAIGAGDRDEVRGRGLRRRTDGVGAGRATRWSAPSMRPRSPIENRCTAPWRPWATNPRSASSRNVAPAAGKRWGVDIVEVAGGFLEPELVVDDDRDGVQAQSEPGARAHRLGVELERTSRTHDTLVRPPSPRGTTAPERFEESSRPEEVEEEGVGR